MLAKLSVDRVIRTMQRRVISVAWHTWSVNMLNMRSSQVNLNSWGARKNGAALAQPSLGFRDSAGPASRPITHTHPREPAHTGHGLATALAQGQADDPCLSRLPPTCEVDGAASVGFCRVQPRSGRARDGDQEREREALFAGDLPPPLPDPVLLLLRHTQPHSPLALRIDILPHYTPNQPNPGPRSNLTPQAMRRMTRRELLRGWRTWTEHSIRAGEHFDRRDRMMNRIVGGFKYKDLR